MTFMRGSLPDVCDRWHGRLPQSANGIMLLSFVIPERLLAVALLFLVTTIVLPFTATVAPELTLRDDDQVIVHSTDELQRTAVNSAMSQQGVPYRYAAASPGVAFDCSGLTSWAWGRAGVYLPHQSAQQYASVAHVPAASAQPGDLLFFYSPISHVGMYIGNGMMIHAPNSGSVVTVKAVNWGNVVGVGRP